MVTIITPKKIKFHIINVYAPLTPAEKAEYNAFLTSLGIKGNFIFLGDFNCFRSALLESIGMASQKDRAGTAPLNTLVEAIAGNSVVPKFNEGLGVITRAVVRKKIPTGAGNCIDHVFVPEKGMRHFSNLLTRDTHLSDHRALSLLLQVGGGKNFTWYFIFNHTFLKFLALKKSPTPASSLPSQTSRWEDFFMTVSKTQTQSKNLNLQN